SRRFSSRSCSSLLAIVRSCLEREACDAADGGVVKHRPSVPDAIAVEYTHFSRSEGISAADEHFAVVENDIQRLTLFSRHRLPRRCHLAVGGAEVFDVRLAAAEPIQDTFRL